MALAPSIICDSIVNSIKHSNLHFLLSENAFSAKITIRKKFIDENRKQPFGAVAESEIVNLKVELDQKTLESDQIHIVNFKLEEANKALAKEITELESDLKQIQAKKNYVENDLRNHASDIEIKEKSFKQAIESFEYTIKLQAAEIHELKLSNENQKNISIKLNKEFNENQTKFKKEKLEMTKQFKKELKMWKKKLGTQTKKSMKLEKKLEESSKEFSALKPQFVQSNPFRQFLQLPIVIPYYRPHHGLQHHDLHNPELNNGVPVPGLLRTAPCLHSIL